jgi:hypothetical protein
MFLAGIFVVFAGIELGNTWLALAGIFLMFVDVKA